MMDFIMIDVYIYTLVITTAVIVYSYTTCICKWKIHFQFDTMF